ncbi:GHKL domain-containing protein [Marinomonas agarivorans]|nr:GHKL domain-containing protein [Marinomonas agarivorans]
MSDDAYKRSYEREKAARMQAEELLEIKSRELYAANQELKQAHESLVAQQSAMVKNEKLASIGTISAGIAHEVNNPLAFVSSNIEMLESYWETMIKLYHLHMQFISQKALNDEALALAKETIKGEDIPYLINDSTTLFTDTKDGLKRVKDIVQNLRDFSRTQAEDWDEVDLNANLESTLKVLSSAIIKNQCEVTLKLGDLPLIWCNAGELNQVFLNLINNGIQAMSDTKEKRLTISTQADEQHVFIRIGDTGMGISTDIMDKIFDPFFTTKGVGKGTGLGLHISQKVVDDHQGKLTVESEMQQGTIFTIQLPLKRRE